MSDPAYGSSPAGSSPSTQARTENPIRVPIGGFASGVASRPEGKGSAGPPPGRPSGSVLTFGRYSGWSLGEVARIEIDYLEWLARMPIGRPYQQEINEILRARGLAPQNDQGPSRGGPFRRR